MKKTGVPKTSEHPIIYSTPMIRAYLDDKKTMTRRVMRTQPTHFHYTSDAQYPCKIDGEQILCPYGQVGDTLWVRETWNVYDVVYDGYNGGWEVGYPLNPIPKEKPNYNYALFCKASDADDGESKYHPSIHMPRWASRLTQTITDIRVERLQDISHEDAIAEGAEYMPNASPREQCLSVPQIVFAGLWDFINAKRGYSWNSNPYVWVLEYPKYSEEPTRC